MEDKERDAINRSASRLQDVTATPRETGTRDMVRVPSLKRNDSVRRDRNNLDPSRLSNNKRNKTFVTGLQIPEHFPALSIHMSEVLDDIGAGKCTVMERRKTFMRRERMWTIAQILTEKNATVFHFGSQSEGTTTPGLNSDIDVLFGSTPVNIMTHSRDWVAGMSNLLILHDDILPPQQYLLQPFNGYRPEPVTSLDDDMYVRKDSGEVLFSAERWKQTDELLLINDLKYKKVTKEGPSVSPFSNWDMVFALNVCKPLPAIQTWVERCRGRHWPSAQLLEAALVAPSLLVPAGHRDSVYNHEEWRLSPNLIKRMLMFSFNMTQIKCYIVLKLIKQSLFNKMVGDFTTSFHCKTLMFYTIQRTPPSLWKEHNLMFLLLLCLQVFRKWLRCRRFPHYIIEGVNLFDGKLSMVQQRRLLLYVDNLIKNNLQDVFCIHIDKLGCRLQARGVRRNGQNGEGELGRVCLRNSIGLLLKFECAKRFLLYLRGIIYAIQSSNTTFEQGIQYTLRTVFQYSTNVELKTVALDFINHLYALHNSVQSSECLRLRNLVSSEIIRPFQYSLNTDVASSRLKLASTLYCCGHLHAAIIVLDDVAKRYHNKVRSVCGSKRHTDESDVQMFANMLSDNCNNVFSESRFAFCVKFVKQERYCAPYILWYEMKRHKTEEELAHRNYTDKEWMDNAEVDACPFLHYLQYLTYKGLGELDKQLQAKKALFRNILDPRNRINRNHLETSMNMLGHCYEMDGNYEGALHYYRESLCILDTNNAANWHILRVQYLRSLELKKN